METLENALSCGLCKRVMTDPVIVITDSNPLLRKGKSYQRDVLEKWLVDNNDTETRFAENQNLLGLVYLYHQML